MTCANNNINPLDKKILKTFYTHKCKVNRAFNYEDCYNLLMYFKLC